jgi:hypothetical protein
MIPNEQFTTRLSKYSLDVLVDFDKGINRFYMLEWHRRCRKTTLSINLVIREAYRNPLSKYLYIAPTQVWARNVVWDDPTMLWGALPSKGEIKWEKNEQRMLITFANGSMVKVCGSDEPDAIRGIDFDGVILDEFFLHNFNVWTEILRPIMSGDTKEGRDRRRWAMFLYTPKGSNQTTQMFDRAACVLETGELPEDGVAKKCIPEWYASRISAERSGIISREELDKVLQDVEDGIIPRSQYDSEYLCRRVTQEDMTMITSSDLERLATVKRDNTPISKFNRIVSIDPAFGGDVCSIKGIENGAVKIERNIKLTLTSEVVSECKSVARELGTTNFIVDCIGNGKGVADMLKVDVAGYNVQYFISSAKTDDDQYHNMKALAVNYVSQQIKKCKIPPITNPEIKRQLIVLSRYKVQPQSGKIILIPNDDVRKVLGCSPDQGLSFVYGIWGLKKTEKTILLSAKSNHSSPYDNKILSRGLRKAI